MRGSDWGTHMLTSDNGRYFWEDSPTNKLVFIPKHRSLPTKEWAVTTALEAIRIALQEDGIRLELK